MHDSGIFVGVSVLIDMVMVDSLLKVGEIVLRLPLDETKVVKVGVALVEIDAFVRIVMDVGGKNFVANAD